MRKVKFRAWDNKRLEMFTCVNDDVTMIHEEVELSTALDWPEVYEVMQFTGLLDKNGKEIYEGDIVVWNTGERFVVRWYAPHAKFLYKYVKKGYNIDNDAGSHEVEVIGNIYESPELLTENL